MHHRAHPVLEPDQVKDVDEQPGEPGDDPGEVKPAGLRDGAVLADGRHHSLVAVAEGHAWSGLDGGEDVLRGRFPHLDGRGREARDGDAVLHEHGRVADHERVGKTRDGEVPLDLDPSRPIELDRSQMRGESLRLHPGGPEDAPRLDALGAHLHSRLVDARDHGAGANLDA